MLGWIFFFSLVAVLYLFWNKQQQARVLALKVVRKHCEQQGLQLLDDTLLLDGLQLRKRGVGWRLIRCYRFDFSSTGDERYAGQIHLAGRRVEQLELDIHRMH